MKTKEQIVAELLKMEAITPEDAAILLTKEYIYVPSYIPQPLQTPWPLFPTYCSQPTTAI